MAAIELINHPQFSNANLVAYYRMSTGALTTDSKGSFTLTNNNTVGETASGKFGYASTTGTSNTNKSFSINNDLGVDGGAISFSFWLKMNGSPATNNAMGIIQHNGLTSHVGEYIYYNDVSGTKYLTFGRTKQGVAANTASYAITLGTSDWYHIAYTFDGSNINGYVNGVSVISPTASSGNGSTGGADKFSIHCLINNSTGALESYSDSTMDDVAVFTDALTAPEVAQIYDLKGGPLFFAQY